MTAQDGIERLASELARLALEEPFSARWVAAAKWIADQFTVLRAHGRQRRVETWLRRVFDEATVSDVKERALRAAEEVIELAQAVGVDAPQLHRLVDYVFGRPLGDPAQEIAGSFITLYSVAVALGVNADEAFEKELARVDTPEVTERVQRRQAEKREALMTIRGEDAGAPDPAERPGNIIFRSGARVGDAAAMIPSGEIRFEVGAGVEIMRFEADGRILVHGREAANDKEVVEAFREWIAWARISRGRDVHIG